jgi:hypothetical protein
MSALSIWSHPCLPSPRTEPHCPARFEVRGRCFADHCNAHLVIQRLLKKAPGAIRLGSLQLHATPNGPGIAQCIVLPCASSDPRSCAIQTVGLLSSNHPDSCRFVVLAGQHTQQTALAEATADQIKLCTGKWHAAYPAFRRELLSLIVRLLGHYASPPVCRETSPRD